VEGFSFRPFANRTVDFLHFQIYVHVIPVQDRNLTAEPPSTQENEKLLPSRTL